MATVCNCKWCHCWPNDPESAPRRSGPLEIAEAELLWWGPTPFGISIGYDATRIRHVASNDEGTPPDIYEYIIPSCDDEPLSASVPLDVYHWAARQSCAFDSDLRAHVEALAAEWIEGQYTALNGNDYDES